MLHHKLRFAMLNTGTVLFRYIFLVAQSKSSQRFRKFIHTKNMLSQTSQETCIPKPCLRKRKTTVQGAKYIFFSKWENYFKIGFPNFKGDRKQTGSSNRIAMIVDDVIFQTWNPDMCFCWSQGRWVCRFCDNESENHRTSSFADILKWEQNTKDPFFLMFFSTGENDPHIRSLLEWQTNILFPGRDLVCNTRMLSQMMLCNIDIFLTNCPDFS